MGDTDRGVDLMTLDELAALLHMKRHTLLNWRSTGQWPDTLPNGFKIGRQVYFDRAAVNEHIAQLAREAG